MTSNLGINDVQPRNLEAPRSLELIPESIRITANNFLMMLEEYYKFMNAAEISTAPTTQATSSLLIGKKGSGPSNVIYSILSELDIDQVDLDYLTHIQSAVAPYVPNPTYMAPTPNGFYKGLIAEEIAGLRAQLYQKIVKYFYNTRGSRNSVASFFQIFYNDTAGVFDASDTSVDLMTSYISTWLTTSGVTLASTTAPIHVSLSGVSYTQTSIQAWLPFTYVIQTSIDQAAFDQAFRALVHPVGFKYVVQPSLSTNGILDVSESRMTDAREDYQISLWCLDSSPLKEFLSYTIADAAGNYNEGYQNTTNYTYADWSNIGSIIKYRMLNFLGLGSSYAYITSPADMTSNITVGMYAFDETALSSIATDSNIIASSYVSISKSIITASGSVIKYLAPDSSIVPGLFITGTGSGITFPSNVYVTSTGTSSVYTTTPVVSIAGFNTFSYATYSSSVIAGVGITGSAIPNGVTVVANTPLGSTVSTVTVPGIGTTVYSANLPAGFYRLAYSTGAVCVVGGGDNWRVSAPGPDTYLPTYVNVSYNSTSGPTGWIALTNSNLAVSGYTTSAAAIAAAQVNPPNRDVYHTGGTMSFYFYDNKYDDNSGSITYTIIPAPTITMSTASASMITSSVSFINGTATLSAAPTGTVGTATFSGTVITLNKNLNGAVALTDTVSFSS
jgi:hypothetical protein